MRCLSLLLLLALATLARAASLPPLAPNDPAWSDLVAAFAHQPDATAEFSEKRFFPFRKAPLELSGHSRVSLRHGLSLDYLAPEKRTVIFDEQGMLVRQADGESPAPSDPRAATANLALVQILRFDLAALAATFELTGQRDTTTWTIVLVPRLAEVRRAVAEIVVSGEAHQVRRIVIRRSPKQFVEIAVGAARPTPFTPAELRQFFR